ncbi:hypothetical protein F66182_6331 [Fusarium sp. NRRL 66182]|nr:hypothetical protein F66182_6331 [Fusarium sp. NRRL 66182]
MVAAALEKLPTGLLIDIAKLLPLEDVKNVSRTSWAMHDAMLRLLFRTLSITCPSSPDRDLDGFIDRYKEVISRLHIRISLNPQREEITANRPEGEPIASVWGASPETVDKVKDLVCGQNLSHIETVIIEFDQEEFEKKDERDTLDRDFDGAHFTQESETWDQAHQEENKFLWRAQYTEIWGDVAANPNIKKLSIINFVARLSQAWKSPRWEAFIERLQDLDISIMGAYLPTYRCAHTTPGFCDFIKAWPGFMMRHANNVRRLRLEASYTGLFGFTSDSQAVPMPLTDGILPSLRSLQVKDLIVGHELLDFIKDHADSLQELELHDCACSSRGDELRWSGIWERIRQINKALIKVSFIQDSDPGLSYDTIEDVQASNKIYEAVENDESLILWRYAQANSHCGIVNEHYEEVMARFWTGEDQSEYEKLLRVVKERREIPSRQILNIL